MGLEDVPHFWGDGWFAKWCDWLAPRNLSLVVREHSADAVDLPPRGYSILIADAMPHTGNTHAVVCRDGEIVHDPRPDSQGVGTYRHWLMFTVLDPVKVLLRA